MKELQEKFLTIFFFYFLFLQIRVQLFWVKNEMNEFYFKEKHLSLFFYYKI